MAGITKEDMIYIEDQFKPFHEEINIIVERQIEMINMQAEIKADVKLLDKAINGNGSIGLVKKFEKHIEFHEAQKEAKKQQRFNNIKLIIGLVIGLISSGVATTLLNYFLK